jgi:type VII secretion protein EccE
MSGNTAKLPRWRLSFPARHVVIAEMVAAPVVLGLARHVWWLALIAVLPVVVGVGLRYRGDTALGWLARAMRRRNRSVLIPDAVSVELPGVGPIGMRIDGQYALTVIALHGRSFPATVLVPEGADTLDVVPLDAVGALLRQFGGLELDSIDVVSAGSRVAPDGRYTPRYDEVIGDRPAVGQRRTWLMLRLCPQACLNALAYRGDVGVAVAAATERIRQAAVRQGCRASTCSAEQLDAVTGALLGGHDVERFEERWSHLRAGNDYLSTYLIAGEDLSSRLLADLWTIRSKMTVTLLRLTRDPAGGVDVAGLVRLHTKNPLTHPPLAALHPLPGKQICALCASLPFGNRSLEMDLSRRPLDGARGLSVPVGPCGPMVGMTIDGVALLMPFTDPLKHCTVAIQADFDVQASLLLRATAAGATAVVHTDRPHVWEPICDERMMLAGGVQNVNTPDLVVADGETAAKRLLAGSGERGHTLVVCGTPPPDCDVVITQVTADELAVEVGQRQMALTVLRPRKERDAFLS